MDQPFQPIFSRNIVLLRPNNYLEWENAFKRRSFQHLDAGRMIREYEYNGSYIYLGSDPFARRNPTMNEIKALNPNISVKSEPNGFDGNDLKTSGAPQLLTDIMTSISSESELKLSIHPQYKEALVKGKFMTIWEIILETHSPKPGSAFNCLKQFTEISQGNKSVEAYIRAFEKTLLDCRNQREAISDNIACTKFLSGLNEGLQRHVRNWEINGNIPTNFNSAKERILALDKLLINHASRGNKEYYSSNQNSKQPKNDKKFVSKFNGPAFTRPPIECSYCGKQGHSASTCRKKVIDLEQEIKDLKKNGSKNVCAATWLLDSGANVSICNNRELLKDITDTRKVIKGVNGDPVTIKEIGNLDGVNDVLLHEECPMQILSFGQLVSQGHILSYDAQLDQFKSCKNDKVTIFNRIPDSNLYGIDCPMFPAISIENDVSMNISTTKDDTVRRFHRILGHPSASVLCKMIRNLDCDITAKDINDAEKRLGPCSDCLRGKLTEPPSFSFDHHANAEVGNILHCDVMYFGMERRKFYFLVCVDHKSGFLSVIRLNDKSATSMFVAMESIIEFYRSHRHDVNSIYFDQDSAIRSAEKRLNSINVNLMLRSPYRHEKNVERYIRTLKECARTLLLSIGHSEDELIKNEYLIPEAVMQASRLLNMRSNSRCPDSFPRMVVTRKAIEQRELLFSFGQHGFCKSHHVKNDVQSRADDAIFIGCPIDSLGFRVYLPDKDQFCDRHDFRCIEEVNMMSIDNLSDMDRDKFDENCPFIGFSDSDVTQQEMDNAVQNECDNMLRMNVYEFVHPSKVKSDKLVHSMMFGKRKYNADGSKGKFKVRIVARGDQQNASTFDDIKANTVDKKCLFICLSICISRNWKLAITDIPSAYLHSDIDQEIYMKLDRDSVKYFLSVRPTLSEMLDNARNLFVRLKKSLYGLKQAGKLWQEELSRSLISCGLTRCVSEPCVFYSDCAIVIFHVDDLCIFYKDENSLNQIMTSLEKFGKIQLDRGPKYQYLGMNIERIGDLYSVSQVGYIEKLISKYPDVKTCKYPYNLDIFKMDGTKSEKIDKNDYLSLIMSLMYLAKLTRPDILMPCSYLASFSSDPRVVHMESAMKIVGYLKATRLKTSIIKASSDLFMYCDASFNVHPDGKGHSGMVMVFGGNILSFSKKQISVAKSSFESEFICLYNSLPYFIEAINFLSEINFCFTAKIFDDNNAVLNVIKNGCGENGSSKHLNQKIHYVKNTIDNNNMTIEYKNTNDMIADILTKPLSGANFVCLQKLLLNNE